MDERVQASIDIGLSAINLPKIAVFLCSHNGGEWIREQINSIFMQNDVLIDLFISDDHSTDKTIQILSEYIGAENTRIFISLPLKKRGSAAANFFHLISLYDCSGYDYIALSDQDDIWFPDKLSRAHKSLVKHGAAGYSSDFIAFWANGRKKRYIKSQPQREFDYIFEGGGPGCSYVMTAKFYGLLRLWVLNNQGLTSKIWMHDWFIYAFARASGESWHIDKFCSFMYRQHSSNSIGVNDGLSSMVSRLTIVNRGLYREQVIFLTQIFPLATRYWVQAFRLKWLGRLYVIKNIHKTRRRLADRFFLLLMCIFNIF